MRIGHKLTAGFLVIIALMLGLTCVGIFQVSRIEASLLSINEVTSVKQRHAIDFRGSVHDRAIALRDLILEESPDRIEGNGATIDRLSADYTLAADGLKQILAGHADTQDRRLLAQIEQQQALVLPGMTQIRQWMDHGERPRAAALLAEQVGPGMETWLASINEFIHWQEEKNRVEATSAMRRASQFSWLMVLATCLALVLGMGTAAVVGRQVVGAFRNAVGIAERISHGDLEFQLDETAGSDEVAQLQQAMARMKLRLMDVVDAQAEMASQHAAGAMDFRIDPSAFAGQFAVMVGQTNALVHVHVATAQQLSDLMGRYALGDLREDMPRLPGQMAVLSDHMDGVKANLGSLHAAIHTLASAAANGDFSVRGNECAFDHDFREMVAGLNALMATVEGHLSRHSQFLQALANGDLSVRLDGEGAGIFAQMRGDANESAVRLGQMVEGIAHVVTGLDEAAAQLLADSTALAQDSAGQARHLEAAADALAVLAQNVNRSAGNAQQADELARGAAHEAQNNGMRMGRSVEGMRAIAATSARMGEIVTVIDGLAFRINLLALNAAVEAARAGEHGRGFAVVADEVRQLAQRSAASAHEIRDLISRAGEQVAAGVHNVGASGDLLQALVGDIGAVSGRISLIADASREQDTSVGSLSKTVGAVLEGTRGAAIRAQKACDQSMQVRGLGQALQRSMSRFRLTV